MTSKAPSALISYSHDSPEHEQRVLEFCNRLRVRGVDAFVDQFLAGAPSEGWPLWMERQIEARDFTLIICTPTYKRRFMEEEDPGIGRGVVWEARILRTLLYDHPERHSRIVPVVFDEDARSAVPTVLRNRYYDVAGDLGFENLLRHLLKEEDAEAGALGPHGSRWSAFERPWLVPDSLRTRYFTGRETLLASLRSQLAQRHSAALSGLGGAGKTQAAFEYALRHRADYPDGVFWVNAENVPSLTSSFAEIAKVLRLTIAAASDQERAVRAALEWLNSTHSWLLIFDNVEDRVDVRAFVPARGRGDLLITSRETVFAELGIARGLEVGDFAADEAVRFLLRRTGRSEDDREKSAAGELAAELGCLPLALEQAAAYVAETHATFAEYLSSFRARRFKLLERSASLMARETVAFTWVANFDAVRHASAAAADILRSCAFLAPDAIPFEIFTKGAPSFGGAIALALGDTDDTLAINETLRSLTRYSLIRSDAGSKTFGVHRLVQEIVRGSLTEADARTTIERSVGGLDAAFPEAVEYETWEQCARLVPHVVIIAGWIRTSSIRSEPAARVLMRAGALLHARARYSEALPLFEQAVLIRESTIGAESADYATSLRTLATAFWAVGRYAEAEPLHARALDITERVLGPYHPDVAVSLNNIAGVRWTLGKTSEIEPLYVRALAIIERAHGPDHLDMTKILNNLAVLRRLAGDARGAEPLLERALAIRERTLGPAHHEVALFLNNLADVRVELGKYAEALDMYERARSAWEGAVGPDHPNVASAVDGLAKVNRKLGRLTIAEQLYDRAVEISESALGPDHPQVGCSLYGLACVYNDQGRIDDARRVLARVLSISEHATHPDLPAPDAVRAELNALPK